ncbi:DUF1778 domain-containing protein [Rahnella contaminans]|uniref:type II toxin-antitoxin system TacA family antitoxin n=1 Tax=Rahnella contaminans TaxID=2703882 RepID=UPI003C2B1A2B
MRNNHLRGGSSSTASATAIREVEVSPEVKSTRLELRTTTDFKEKVRSASALLGLDMSSFIVLAATDLAQKTMEKQRIRLLTEEAWDKLNALIDAPVVERDDDLERLMLRKRRYVVRP